MLAAERFRQKGFIEKQTNVGRPIKRTHTVVIEEMHQDIRSGMELRSKKKQNKPKKIKFTRMFKITDDVCKKNVFFLQIK